MGHMTEAEALANEVTRKGSRLSLNSYTSLVSMYARAGAHDAAAIWFDRARQTQHQLDTGICNSVLPALAVQESGLGNVSDLLTYMRRHRITPDHITILQVFQCLRKRGQLQEIIRIYDRNLKEYLDAENPKIERKWKVILIQALVQTNQVARIDAFLRGAFHKDQDRVLMFSTAINSFIKLGSLANAERLIRLLQEEHNLTPNISVWNTLLNRVAKCERAGVHRILAHMRKEDIVPSTATYNIVIGSSLRGQGNSKMAKSYLQEMEKYHIEPNRFTWNLFFEAFARDKDVDSLIQTLARCHPDADVRAYTMLMKRIVTNPCSAAELESARQLLRNMSDSGNTLPNPDLATYTVLIAAYARHSHLIDETDSLFIEAIQVPGFDLDTKFFNSYMHALARAGRHDQCRDIYDGMVERGMIPTVETFTILLRAIESLNGQQSGSALEWILQQMEYHHVAPDRVLFGCLIDALSKGPDITTLEMLLKRYRYALRPPEGFWVYQLQRHRRTFPVVASMVTDLLYRGLLPGSEQLIKVLTGIGVTVRQEEHQWIINFSHHHHPYLVPFPRSVGIRQKSCNRPRSLQM
ncbi:hypothetical protein DFS34DRAFT_596136 [Phlyctochytrium arcticum]|nr:hypothetical protein DFS34DRAFT_596136 [Phlyctochytrium arcticum]